jgi:hypothetical protein
MTDETTAQSEWGSEEPAAGADAGTTSEDTTTGGNAGTGRTIDVQPMLNQLQGMIDQVATNSGPALRQVAAKAAELAAAAAKRAGPIAISIATKTEQVSQAVAGRAERLATDLRSGQDGETPGEESSGLPEADRPVAEEESVTASPA